ncbi:hypothetical protein DMN77_14810 [Paenibacillus sp. 79R4]|uniref:hypothetical protein n=1 Tax=Paenibacillus sp. 79R4 TaxID=2212847 RepID=UPI0015B93FA2|nr:hypothetical protein [Paenibacillus sp. 79R4]NWL88831.1 hypothetical protein [Paenibacillus sp. 79R4]
MMIDLHAREKAKISVIESIARSQMALARILDSMADVTHSEGTARHLVENVKILMEYQQAIARTICGVTLHHVNYGTPSSPWITNTCYAAKDATRGEQEEDKIC